MMGSIALSWLLTYAAHSTVLLVAVWLLDRRVLRAAVDREHAWKAATFGAIITATLQLALLTWKPETAPVVVHWQVPATSLHVGGPVQPTEAPQNIQPELSNGPSEYQAAREPAPRYEITWPRAALTLWCAGLLLGLARLHFRRRLVVRHVGPRRPIENPQLLAMLDDLCIRARFRRPVLLTSCDRNISPMVIGGGEICLPSDLVDRLSERQRRSVLAHELAHLVRRDPEWLRMFCFAEVLLFFQPMNFLARRRVQECAEYACDADAARLIDSPIPMAETLVQVARWMQVRHAPLSYPAMAEDSSLLSARVQKLLSATPARISPRRRYAALTLLLGIALIAPAVTNAVPALQLPAPQQDDKPRFEPFSWSGGFANGGEEFVHAYNAWRNRGAKHLAAYIARQQDATVRFAFRSRNGVCGTGVEHDGSRMFALQPESGWLPAGKNDQLLLYTSHGGELRRNIVGVDGQWTVPCQAAPTRVDIVVRKGVIADLQITVGNPAPRVPNLRDLAAIPAPIAGSYLLTLVGEAGEISERALLAAVMGEGGAGPDEMHALIADRGVAPNLKAIARRWAESLEHYQPKKPGKAEKTPKQKQVGISNLGLPLPERIALMKRMSDEELIAVYDDVPDRVMRVEIIQWLSPRSSPAIIAKLRDIVNDASVVEEQDAAMYALMKRPSTDRDIAAQVVLTLVNDPRQPLDTRKRALKWAGSRGVSPRVVEQILPEIESPELKVFIQEWLAKYR